MPKNMSKEKGKILICQYGITREDLLFTPTIKWNKKTHEFVLYVPDMYQVVKLNNPHKLNKERVYISEIDLLRMINSDRGCNEYVWFSYEQERGDLDDSTYYGICVIQQLFYLTQNTLRQAKKVRVKNEVIELKPRVPRGGRPVGGGRRKPLTEEEKERLEYLTTEHDRIVENCIKHDWANEYVDMEKEIARLRGSKVPNRKNLLEEFGKMRREYYK